MEKELEIAKKINKEISKMLYPENPDRPLFYEVHNKLNKGIRMENNGKVWLEPDEFYEIFEKICRDNIKDVDEKDVLEYFKIEGHSFPKYYITEVLFSFLETKKYVPTLEIMKRELYLKYFSQEAVSIDKDEQMFKIANELEELLLLERG